MCSIQKRYMKYCFSDSAIQRRISINGNTLWFAKFMRLPKCLTPSDLVLSVREIHRKGLRCPRCRTFVINSLMSDGGRRISIERVRMALSAGQILIVVSSYSYPAQKDKYYLSVYCTWRVLNRYFAYTVRGVLKRNFEGEVSEGTMKNRQQVGFPTSLFASSATRLISDN